jgi:antirestriction protein ArdC
MTKPSPRHLHVRITEAIVAAIEAGAGEYRMPWHSSSGTGAFGAPHNPVGRYRYRGINILSLWCAQRTMGYGSSQWASYRQWQAAGRQVRPGEIGTPTVGYSELAGISAAADEKKLTEAPTHQQRRVCLVRIGTVFNADQLHQVADLQQPYAASDPFPVAASLIAQSGAVIRHGRTHACYVPSCDEIHLPPRTAFVSDQAEYGVAFHELTHWTGHRHRCARDLSGRFGSQAYAMEELIAELGAAFLSADVGLAAEPRMDPAQYIESWLQVLKTDTRALFLAAGKAAQACEYLYPPRTATNQRLPDSPFGR